MNQRALQQGISATHAWYQAYGNDVTETGLATFVGNRATPDIWSANHVSRVRAESPDEIETVHGKLDEHLAHCQHRAATTDMFTPSAFTASLAMRDYEERPLTIQMVLDELTLPDALPDIMIEPVATETDWAVLRELVGTDYSEGARSGRLRLDDRIIDDMVSHFRRKSAIQHFFIARQAGIACAYGSAVCGPDPVGMLEDYFTLPSHRGRAIAAALIDHGVNHLKERDYSTVFLGAHARERAKHLYAKLGFRPVMLTREWLKNVTNVTAS